MAIEVLREGYQSELSAHGCSTSTWQTTTLWNFTLSSIPSLTQAVRFAGMNSLNLYKCIFALVVILLETSFCICYNSGGADEPVAEGGGQGGGGVQSDSDGSLPVVCYRAIRSPIIEHLL